MGEGLYHPALVQNGHFDHPDVRDWGDSLGGHPDVP